MRSRKLKVAATIAAPLLLVAGAQIVRATGNRSTSSVKKQAFQASGRNESTKSSNFTRLTGLSNFGLANGRGVVSGSVSANFRGGPVDLRVRLGTNGPVLRPGVAHFDPARGSTSFSYTFAAKAGPCAQLNVEWKSRSGDPVTFTSGNVVALYPRLGHGQLCA